jgi:hypothetical protein
MVDPQIEQFGAGLRLGVELLIDRVVDQMKKTIRVDQQIAEKRDAFVEYCLYENDLLFVPQRHRKSLCG